jgi:hypothetical protein
MPIEKRGRRKNELVELRCDRLVGGVTQIVNFTQYRREIYRTTLDGCHHGNTPSRRLLPSTFLL